MSLPQQKFRELLFQMLYSYDLSRVSEEDIIPLLMKELSITKKSAHLAHDKMVNILDKKKEIDALIAKTSVSYAFDRIQTVDRNVLRIGVYELLFDDTIPPKVAITEAMRLSRKFSSPEAALFVNAILDTIYRASIGEALDKESLDIFAKNLAISEENEKLKEKEALENKEP